MYNKDYIFIDNITFHDNNIIYKFLKRWIIYKIIEKINNNHEIIIGKTLPQIIVNKFNNSNLNNVNNIISIIENIIFKKYDDIYPTIHFKNIIDYFNELNDDNINEIFIITSINKDGHFSEDNINSINNFLKNEYISSKINLINISKNKLEENGNFKNIYNIDFKETKITKIILNKIFKVTINLNFYKKTFIEKNINLDNNQELLYLINELYKIEKYIYNLILNDSYNDIELDYIEENLKINLISTNIKIKNILKNYLKSINDSLNLLRNINFKNIYGNINHKLNDTYIKYIIEFYELIYPKLNNNNYIKNKINLSLINVLENRVIENDNLINKSLDFTNSNLTMTNWLDEYNNYNPFGILIKYKIDKFSHKGIIHGNYNLLYSYPNIIINSVNNNWCSIYDYYQLIQLDLDNRDEYDDYFEDHNNNFNINNFNITDNLLGDSNVLIPIYINKDHWKLLKPLWKYHMSFIHNCYENEYNKKMDNIYFLILLKKLNSIIDKYNSSKNINNNDIILFNYILRTCIQIMIDNKYLNSIKNEHDKYFKILMNDKKSNVNNVFNYIIRLIQLIISNNSINLDLKYYFNKIEKLYFKFFIEYNYKIDFWETYKQSNDENFKKEKLDEINENYINENICWFNLKNDLTILNQFIIEIYNKSGFNQYIKINESNYGFLDNDNQKLSQKHLNDSLINIIDKNQIDISNIKVNIDEFLI